MVKPFRVRDPIHNLIRIPIDERVVSALLNSRPLQRLRHVKQLGFSDFVYPGASHTRFSHSIGTMAMARKILEALRRNSEIDTRADFLPMSQATICAAILHDVGHGPFSHVFEEIREDFSYHRSHEEFTIAVIMSAEITDILGEELKNNTRNLIESEDAGLYKNIISHQIDADRLDFIQRDKHFTGIRFGSIDIEWILDSLCVQEAPYGIDPDDIRHQFVFEEKGLQAVEEFLSSYVKMYSDVYFHKTTRAVQFLFTDALKSMISHREQLQDIGINSALFQYFDAIERYVENNPNYRSYDIWENDEELEILEIYLTITDATLVDLISRCASHKDCPEETKEFCRRFLDRDIYKCLRTKIGITEKLSKQRDFHKKLRSQDIMFIRDELKAKGLKQYNNIGDELLKNILIKKASNGEPVAIHEISETAKTLAGQGKLRYYFHNSAERDLAKEIWQNL